MSKWGYLFCQRFINRLFCWLHIPRLSSFEHQDITPFSYYTNTNISKSIGIFSLDFCLTFKLFEVGVKREIKPWNFDEDVFSFHFLQS